MTRDDLRALRELANAAVDPHTLPPTMSEAYGALLLRLIEEHETPWTDAHWTEYERAIAAAEAEILLVEEQLAFEAWRDSLETVPTRNVSAVVCVPS